MGKITVSGQPPSLERACEIMRSAAEQVSDQRNNRKNGQPDLEAIDLLTDAVDAYLAELRRETRKRLDNPERPRP